MNIKKSTLFVSAALYAASIANAATAEHTYTIKPIELGTETIKSRVQSVQATDHSSLLEGNGLNVHMQPSKKFIREEGIHGSNQYIIRLKDAPAALYEGDATGAGATKTLFANTTLGARKVDLRQQPTIAAYIGKLEAKQESFIAKAKVKGIAVDGQERFQIALNAVTATLTQDEAEELAKLNEVASISRVVNHELLMDRAQHRTNVTDVWTDENYTESNGEAGLKGEGMLIGVIDTGINSQHPSFAATGGDGYTVVNPLGTGEFLHDCLVEGQEYLCNDKLIGVWSHPMITAAFSDPQFEQSRPENGEDYQGHGSHTAGIAAGNVLFDVPYKKPAMAVTHPGLETDLVLEKVSGIAPHANLIAYQVCYPGNGGDLYAGCPSIAGVAAIEQAILDGVDVINYSISGGVYPHADPVELAFLAAHEAGINVAASAGNAGAYRSVNHISPWLLSVASTQHGRTFTVNTQNRIEGASYNGSDVPASYRLDVNGWVKEPVTGDIVLAENFGDELCLNPFPAGTFASGEIVACARGENPLIDKSANAAAGGASAVIIYNTNDSSQDMYPYVPHSIPTVQMDSSDAPYFVTWLNDADGHQGTLPAMVASENVNTNYVDAISPFSSIGHAYYEEYREATAPSIAAPGSDIYSAYSEDQPFTRYAAPTEFIDISGTSMSSPHIAGALALIKQARPDWTPSEVMSAMQLTANDVVGDKYGREDGTNPWFYGSGIAQVDKAINSPLIMHVPVEDYTVSDPTRGGNLGALNTPNMVDSQCFQSCSWVREVEATVDGTFTADIETGEYSVDIKVHPETFTLKAGEKQRLIITGSWVDSKNSYESPRGATVMGKVNLSHNNEALPVASMNVEMVLDSGKLPETLEFETHNRVSTFGVENLAFGDAPNIQATVYQPVKVAAKEIELVERSNSSGTSLFPIALDLETVHVEMVNVPVGAKRLIAEVIEHGEPTDPFAHTKPIANVGIYLGFDADMDGEVDYDEEVICKSVISSSEMLDWCNVPNPEVGTYWVVFQEHNANSKYYDPEFSEHRKFKSKIATTVVMADEATTLTVETPDSSTAEDLSSVSIEIDGSDWMEGEMYRTAIEFGSDENNLDNIGLISANIVRGVNEVSMAEAEERVAANSYVNYSMSVLPNMTGMDRSFTITGEIPEGLELIAESVILEDNRFVEAEVLVEGNTFTITGLQPNTSDMERFYEITNSLTNAQCKTPVGDGSYVDLNAYGINPVEGAPASNTEAPLQVTFNEIFRDNRSVDEEFALYGTDVTSFAKTNSIYIHSNGMINLLGRWHPTFGAGNMAYNNDFNPFYVNNMGVLWHGAAGFGANGMQYGAPYSLDDNGDGVSGISFVQLVDEQNRGTHVLVEWDNLQHVEPDGICGFRGCPPGLPWKPMAASTTKLDAQVIFARDYKHAEGEFEIVYAYNNLNWGNYTGNGSLFQEEMSIENSAVAGVIGFSGTMLGGTPIGGFHRQSIIPDFDGFGGLNNFLQDNMAVCMDYRGPEVSEMSLSFTVKVPVKATGQEFDINVNADFEGSENTAFTKSLSIPSNISLFSIDDQTTDENETLAGIQVIYMDNNNVSNVISVEGEGFTAEVNGHETGSTFNIVPNENWHGETEVTVTVADSANATDAQSVSFMLSVMSDGVEYGCTDQAATNYNSNANEDDGSCTYPVAEEPKEEDSSNSSGGSFGIFSLMLLTLPLALRRRLVK